VYPPLLVADEPGLDDGIAPLFENLADAKVGDLAGLVGAVVEDRQFVEPIASICSLTLGDTMTASASPLDALADGSRALPVQSLVFNST